MCPQWHRGSCKVCERTAAEVGDISGTGLCREHSEERKNANNVQISEHRGPYFDNWRRRSVAAFGGILLDDQKAS